MTLNIKELRVSSEDFDAGTRLDDVHAWDKENIVPRLTLHGVPEGTVELAVVCHDPDAPLPFGFTHWTLYGIRPLTTELGRDADEVFRPGPNGTGEPGYVGPLPPAGHGPHHYYFWVYALDTTVVGTPSREEFLERYGENIIEQNRIVATYEN